MKLRNKKTGEITETHLLVVQSVEDPTKRYYAGSIKDLCDNYEDYKPKQPYIEDEKVRKAVRVWAEMNDIRFIRMCSRTRKENARIVGQNALGRTFTMEIDNEYEIRVCFKDYKECYTIAELCGEEEEC